MLCVVQSGEEAFTVILGRSLLLVVLVTLGRDLNTGESLFAELVLPIRTFIVILPDRPAGVFCLIGSSPERVDVLEAEEEMSN